MGRVVVTGGTGFVGRALTARLASRGDECVVLTRGARAGAAGAEGGVRFAPWDPDKGGAWTSVVDGADAIVHLAGENVAQRWTPAVKERIARSRVDTTRLLVDAIGGARVRPKVLVSASAIGFYGPRGPDEVVDEQTGPGQGFLADVVQAWETAARGAEEHGVRVSTVRVGVVLGRGGGALEKMVLPFKLFAGGPIGSGDQVIPWVHLDDVVGLFLLCLDDPAAGGALNAVAPCPVTSREMARALGEALGRPSSVRTPAFAVRLALGEAADIALTGQRVRPVRAEERGYRFMHPELGEALAEILRP